MRHVDTVGIKVAMDCAYLSSEIIGNYWTSDMKVLLYGSNLVPGFPVGRDTNPSGRDEQTLRIFVFKTASYMMAF